MFLVAGWVCPIAFLGTYSYIYMYMPIGIQISTYIYIYVYMYSYSGLNLDLNLLRMREAQQRGVRTTCSVMLPMLPISEQLQRYITSNY